ncbi:hypothetical protein MJO28_001251 [Puccinia striiformis f. sp. tritici]|uniref:Uncharacterized protein n=4 Tax=Puccinia striiformis TaxID=27350 RepID=A0A0L0URI6_9BASI|nr:hypothetical protein Pst134EA_003504 [Puccinia striiformis f. sp. tritici]KNE89693.1 hypothetical protein PSTG_16856 [Puccinia striiformis f. sp. tritici PST-78]POV98817.1 hypothetical protein PSHT_13845 [Puccinia striiformis]KAH9465081.1 hypothetical protein Pst134EB_004567 [Puccinia striiformis f. sp. tritici]KAH9472905.1 hypothetical protein Pst134EA_003504 [Puccinia striiformis f. sp. tritici]KAI7960762.1 hypothetical protein MJO28_001251 [Puccinia striiformis f. sp. tritici]
MTARPTPSRSDSLSSIPSRSTTRGGISGYSDGRRAQFGIELRLLEQTDSTSSSSSSIYEQSVAEAETELLNRSLELIESYLSQSDDRSLRLVINLHESPFDSSVTQDQTQLDEVGSSLPIDSLGEDALENCIPPPYCSPSLSGSESLLSGGDRSNCSSIGLLDSQRARLKSLKPWHSFTPLTTGPDPAYDLKLFSASSSPDSQRRGFWLIPVWKSNVTKNDYYGRFGHLVSLPTWSDPRLSPPLKPPSTTAEAQNVQMLTTITWNPIRLSLFWKVICIICEKRKLGDVSATALATSHTKDILPYIKSISATGILVSPEPEDVYGDHIRIWSNLQTSLILRRVISDITIKSAIQAHGTQHESDVPFIDLDLDREELRNQAGDLEQKWLKNCVFMWLDETGTPRGYG